MYMLHKNLMNFDVNWSCYYIISIQNKYIFDIYLQANKMLTTFTSLCK